MKRILIFLMVTIPLLSQATSLDTVPGVRPSNFPLQTTTTGTDFEFYSQFGGVNKKSTPFYMRKYFATQIDTATTRIVAATGNAESMRNRIVRDTGTGANVKYYLIDFNGTAFQLYPDGGTGGGSSYYAGSGITISTGNVISNNGDLDPSDDILNTTSAGGDLSGTYPGPVVIGLQGRSVASTAPTNGQALKWNSTTSKWEPAADANTTYAAGAGISLAAGTFTNTGDTNASDDITNSTSASGDLSGTFPGPTVAKIRGVTMSASAPSNGQVIKYNSGSSQWEPAADATGGGGGTAVDTVPDYTSLRAYAGSSLAVYVTSSRSGGLFIRSTTGTEDGGTLIIASNSVKWKRVWDGVNIYPEWWEINGTAPSGLRTGSTILTESDAINAACKVGGRSAVINLAKEKLYTVDQEIRMQFGQSISGNNATIKRAAMPNALIGTNYTANSTSLVVSNGALFRKGQQIIISDTLGPTGGQGGADIDKLEGVYVSNVSGNTLTLAKAFTNSHVAGQKVSAVATLIVVDTTNVNDSLRVMELAHLNLDGNRAQNSFYKYWDVNHALFSGRVQWKLTEVNSFNAPTESFVMGSGYFLNCKGFNNGGSFYHNVKNDNAKIDNTVMINCVVDSTNLNDNAIAGHSEAVLVLSFNSVNIHIENCHFKDGYQGIIGWPDEADNNISITNCTFENFNKGIVMDGGTGGSWTGDESYVNIRFCQFINCGRSYFAGYNLQQGKAINKLDIIGNKFINSTLELTKVDRVRIFDNDFLYDTDQSTTNLFTTVTTDSAMLDLNSFSSVRIERNNLSGPVQLNAQLSNGIFVSETAFTNVKDSSATNVTGYGYSQHVTVASNFIKNFAVGIASEKGVANMTLATARSAVGWRYTDNYIIGSRDTAWSSVCMQVRAGTIARNNTIIIDGTWANCYGIVVEAINSSGNDDFLLGGIAEGNLVYGVGNTIPLWIGGLNTQSTSGTNAIARNNTLFKNPAGKGNWQAGNLTDGNLVLDSTMLSALVSPQVPFTHSFEELKSSY